MIFVILGPSGCGKGTQAKLLSQKLSIPTISTGDLIRTQAAAGSIEAVKAKEYADRGLWPPDQLVESIFTAALSKLDPSRGLILDGTPRTVEQAKWLDETLALKNVSVSKVIHLETTINRSLDRIKSRLNEEIRTGKVRSDETDSAIKERFDSYAKTIEPIKKYYDGQGKLILVNNEQPIEDVYREICQKLNFL